MSTLKVFSAGVAGKLAHMTVDKLKENESIECDLQMGGSNAGINRLLAGEKFDVMILADNSGIDQLMMPSFADGYYIWGGNAMTVSGNDITNDNWIEKLLDPNSKIKHMNPYDDPGGYRAVMAYKLADKYQKGLSEKLFNNPGYDGLNRDNYIRKTHPKGKPPIAPAGMSISMPDNEYLISYRSLPVNRGINYVTLPDVMNLGNPEFESDYQSVSFVVDGGAEIFGTTIYHAIVIPKNSVNKKLAERFVREFLQNDFTNYGFTDVQKSVGIWNL